MTGETEGKKSLKRYFPYKEYTIKAEFGFSLLDKEVYVIFFSICFTAKTEKILISPKPILCLSLFRFAPHKLDSS